MTFWIFAVGHPHHRLVTLSVFRPKKVHKKTCSATTAAANNIRTSSVTITGDDDRWGRMMMMMIPQAAPTGKARPFLRLCCFWCERSVGCVSTRGFVLARLLFFAFLFCKSRGAEDLFPLPTMMHWT